MTLYVTQHDIDEPPRVALTHRSSDERDSEGWEHGRGRGHRDGRATARRRRVGRARRHVVGKREFREFAHDGRERRVMEPSRRRAGPRVLEGHECRLDRPRVFDAVRRGTEDTSNVVVAAFAVRECAQGTLRRQGPVPRCAVDVHDVVFVVETLEKRVTETGEAVRRRLDRVRGRLRVPRTRVVRPSSDLGIDFDPGKDRAGQELFRNAHGVTMQLLRQVPPERRAVLDCQDAVAKVRDGRGRVLFFGTRPLAAPQRTRQGQVDGRRHGRWARCLVRRLQVGPHGRVQAIVVVPVRALTNVGRGPQGREHRSLREWRRVERREVSHCHVI